MPDLDEFAGEVAAELMEWSARRVNRLEVKNTVGGHENLADLSESEYEDFVTAVLDRIEHADITIDTSGG